MSLAKPLDRDEARTRIIEVILSIKNFEIPYPVDVKAVKTVIEDVSPNATTVAWVKQAHGMLCVVEYRHRKEFGNVHPWCLDYWWNRGWQLQIQHWTLFMPWYETNCSSDDRWLKTYITKFIGGATCNNYHPNTQSLSNRLLLN